MTAATAAGGYRFPGWVDDAACAGRPAEMDTGDDWQAALAIATYCDRCPVLANCDALLKTQHVPTGVWAGRWYTPAAGGYRSAVKPLTGVLGRARAHIAGYPIKTGNPQ